MGDTNSQTQKHQIQGQLSPTHTGNGGLRGGGIRTRLSIRDETLVHFGSKLERRIGPIMLFCLVTVVTVLIINALYHESANGTLVELIEGIQHEILELQHKEVAQFVGIEGSTTTTTTSTTKETISNNDTSVEENESISEETFPTAKSTSDALRPIVLKRTEQMAELNLYKERFYETDRKIILIILICVLGILLGICGVIVCRRRNDIKLSKSSRIAYGLILAAICSLLIIQLFMFLISLLPNAFAFNSLVDKLLNFYLNSEVPVEKRQALIDPIENNFGCKLKVEHQLLEQMGVQEPCAPKIKDRLLAPYIVLFLILIVLSPFLYALFIILWSKKLKEVTPILNARHKVAYSNEARMRRFNERMETV